MSGQQANAPRPQQTDEPNEQIVRLHQEQAALRDRVRRQLAACAGELLHTPPPLPPPPPSCSHMMPPMMNPPMHAGFRGNGMLPSPYPPGMPPPHSMHHAPPLDPAVASAAHTELQRALLAFLVSAGTTLRVPMRPDILLHMTCERFPEVAKFEAALQPSNVAQALMELQALVGPSVRVERGELISLDSAALGDFQTRLLGGRTPTTSGAPSATAVDLEKKTSRKRSATAVQDEELAEVMELVSTKTIKQQEKQEQTDELLELLSKPSAKQAFETERFRTVGGSKLKEFCRHGTKEDCVKLNGAAAPCQKIHFRRIINPHTDVTLGDCSYLDTCRHMSTCKFIHYEVDAGDAQQMRAGRVQLDPFARVATNRLDDDPFYSHYDAQFLNCDIRTFPMQVLGKFPVIMADPPWDIHMELPYGTMSDDEMRRMNVQVLQDDGVIFLWVTGRAMELGRECLDIWGYKFVQELLWVKTNQLQRIIRTGRTGHWINHSKEHCLIGLKGSPRFNNNIDCDVVCAEVRETSRKPDEMYDLLERLAPGCRKLELFGRPHNVHKGWTTLGNQLGKTQITEPWLRQHVLEEGVFEENDLATMPTPPENPIVVPWGGEEPPARLSEGERPPSRTLSQDRGSSAQETPEET